MRGDKIHSSLQFQGWRSCDLRKVQRLMREERSLMRDIIGDGSSTINVCQLQEEEHKACADCAQQV